MFFQERVTNLEDLFDCNDSRIVCRSFAEYRQTILKHTRATGHCYWKMVNHPPGAVYGWFCRCGLQVTITLWELKEDDGSLGLASMFSHSKRRELYTLWVTQALKETRQCK